MLVGCRGNTDGNQKNSNFESSYSNIDGTNNATTSEDKPLNDKKNNAIGTATSSSADSTSLASTDSTSTNTSTSSSNSQTNQSSDKKSSSTNSSGSTTTSSQTQNSSSKTEHGIVLPDDEWD